MRLAKHLQMNKTLTKLNIEGLDLNVFEILQMMQAIQGNSTLQEVKMSITMDQHLDRDHKHDKEIKRYHLSCQYNFYLTAVDDEVAKLQKF